MIADKLLNVKAGLPAQVQLVAVSKYHPEPELMEAYEAGQRLFGENIVQELRRKQEALPKDIAWHFIGHLQRNKVKYIAPYVAMIHAVDSLELLQEIDRQAAKHHRTINCLLQIHVAREETKFGLTFDACRELLAEGSWRGLEHVAICGLMCIASNVDDDEAVRAEFHRMNTFFNEIKQAYFADDERFCERSWGMSDDYPLAIAEGSTMVRVGSLIFGERPTKTEVQAQQP